MSISHHGYYGPPPSGFGGSQYPHHDQQQRQFQHYPHPQPPPPPPPPAVYPRDPVSFRREYSARLNDLAVNSRPIIQDLSMLAHEYYRYSEIVAQCLESHIRRVPPWMKLPAFYLLDMISKNIYEPYSREFQAFVAPLFLESYGLVDDSTRGKMEELLLTWRTGSPARKELFGAAVQVSIERGIWGDGSNHASSSGSSTSQITKSQVLSELDFAYSQKERACQANPYDKSSQTHAAVLQQVRSPASSAPPPVSQRLQLRGVVEGGVSQAELHQILSQLRTLVKESAPPPPIQVPPPQVVPHSWPPQQPGPSSYPLQPPVPPPVKLEAPPTTLNPPAPISALLSSLLKAGVVSTTGTPEHPGSSSIEEETAPQEMEREASRMYRHDILSQSIQLTTSDITKKRPAIQYFLYDQLPAQCRQCGIRYPDTAIGKKLYQDHMDMHFRQNRKSSQNMGRGHSRSWFVGLDDWTHDRTSSHGKPSRRPDAKATAAAETAKREAELRAQYVVVPQGDEAKQISCPICKETLSSEFLEQDEEWVWRNAVQKDGQIYHATCHADALSATSSLTARLRSGLGGSNRSRSTTPDLLATPPRKLKALSPSPDSKSAGIKRKADESTWLSHEGEGTPPNKKMAVAV